MTEKRALKVFLCHASGDKPPVRDLYKRLVREGIDAWLDQEKLLPGQDWRVEIPRAVQEADVVVVCLSNKSITKEGYIQKEIKFALDSADEKPEGTIFLIPARLEDCPVPDKLSRWHWVDLYEEDGYLKLLRSLKLRADKAGASISPSAYVDDDAETERRLDQYYTEGLAAFYTEDWNRAVQRFQLILSERPNHQNALEKLEEAERRRDLANLYAQAMDAVKIENWETAIKALEDLLKKSPDYRDAAGLLKNARRREQLGELYSEAKKLHEGGKWQAVVKVFDQIHALEPDHPDPNGLLPSAQREAAEVKRLADLNDLYSRALREMDLGKWAEARGLLEQVHKSQTGFMETERLLRKADDELRKVAERNQVNNQINTLYEQAHGLVRAKSWRKALDKIEEIRKLDNGFADKDGIVEKINTAFAQEEQQAQKQNQLAAMYADAVRLLKEEKHADSLAKWDEVKAADPKYPDRQWVERTARKKLNETAKISPARKIVLPWKIIVPAAAVLGLVLFAVFNPSLLSSILPEKEVPIQIKIVTSSDWVKVTPILRSGTLTNVDLVENSPEATNVSVSSGVFTMNQPIERTDGIATIALVLEAKLTLNGSDDNLAFIIESGCIGETTVQFWRVGDESALVKSVDGITPCDYSVYRIEIPAELFTN